MIELLFFHFFLFAVFCVRMNELNPELFRKFAPMFVVTDYDFYIDREVPQVLLYKQLREAVRLF